IVRDIYARYLELGNVRLVAEQLVAEGIGAPLRVSSKGQAIGGCPLTRGQLNYILKNPIYAGNIAHKGTVHPGNHDAIIEREKWDRVQARLAANVQGERSARVSSTSLLTGLLYDADREPLVPVHARKAKTQYRYYVSRFLQHGTEPGARTGMRIPAREIEQVVRQELTSLMGDPLLLAHACGLVITPEMLAQINQDCANALPEMLRSNAKLAGIVSRITIRTDRIDIELALAGISKLFGVPASHHSEQTFTQSASVRLTRTGHVVRLVHDNGVAALKQADPSLVRLILKARHWWNELAKGEITIQILAVREGVSASYITRVVRLAFLAPDIVEAILAGTMRAGIDGVTMVRTGAVPEDWDKQRMRFLSGVSG
ncbi:recombinase family protein, partial [Erythrobacter ramosus]|uniref:recombinase family protein n=1 Tax=Erythrobacter ramosus TaxID=35811 RepID=UPI00160BA889